MRRNIRLEDISDGKLYTAEDMVNLGVCDHIIPEPAGGAHMNHQVMAGNISDYLIAALKNLTQKSIANLLEARYNKFRKIGAFQEESF